MTPWTGAADGLSDRIAAFVASDGASEPFEALALDVHRWQRAHDPVLASLTDGEPRAVTDIPAVPVGLFKDLPVGTVPPGEEGVVFRTSGTTGGGRGAHRLRSTALYDLGASRWFRRCVPDAPGDVSALLESPHDAPDSSLSHMVARFGQPPGGVTWHLHGAELDRDGLNLRHRAMGRRVFLAATAFALAEYLDGPTVPLPPGSVLMVTGGFKGRVARVDDAALYALARERLGPARLVTEYGMTELSSQLWGTPETPYLAPPWLRAVAVDPVSGRPLPPGSFGQLRFYDLCNLDGTLGIETLDGGVVHDDGSVTLHGRLPGAPARGCSLTVEEAWALRGRSPPEPR